MFNPDYADYTQSQNGSSTPSNQVEGYASNQRSVYPVIHVPKDLKREAFNETNQLLWAAHDVAESILKCEISKPSDINPELVKEKRTFKQIAPNPVIRSFSPIIDLSDRSTNVSMFNTQTNVNVPQQTNRVEQEEQKKKEKQADTTQRVLVGLIGLVVAGVAAFFIGKATAKREEIQDETANFKELKEKWEKNKSSFEMECQTLVNDVVKRVDSILQTKRTNQIQNIALLTFGLIAGGTAFAGAILASKAAMTAGIVIGATAGVLALGKAGYSYFSTRQQKIAEGLDSDFNKWKKLRQDLVIG